MGGVDTYQQHFPKAEQVVVRGGGGSLVGLVQEEGHAADYQQHAQVLGHGVLLPQDGHAQDHHCKRRGM